MLSKRNIETSESTAKLAKRILKKHTAIVHCSNTLTLLQRKISNALLYNAYENLLIEEEHSIRIGELCELIGYKGHNYEAVKSAFKELITTVIEWNLIDKETNEEDWTASSILSSVNLKSSLCTYSYSPRMKILLKTPAMYAKINLFVQSHFRSAYGLALYENCIRYHGLPSTGWFEIEMFRKMMGVPNGVYKIFKDFKKRVIDNAVNEVNSFSTIFIEPEFEKNAKIVKKIRFQIKYRQKKKPLGNVNCSIDKVNSLKTKLVEEFNFSEITAKKMIGQYEDNYIYEKIALIEDSKQFHSGTIKNLGGLLVKALNNDFKPSTPQSLLRYKNNKKSLLAKEDSESFKLTAQFERHQHNEILDKFKNINKISSEKILLEFNIHLGSSMYLNVYKKLGLNDYLVAQEFVKFILKHYSEIAKDLTTYEEFIAEKKSPVL